MRSRRNYRLLPRSSYNDVGIWKLIFRRQWRLESQLMFTCALDGTFQPQMTVNRESLLLCQYDFRGPRHFRWINGPSLTRFSSTWRTCPSDLEYPHSTVFGSRLLPFNLVQNSPCCMRHSMMLRQVLILEKVDPFSSNNFGEIAENVCCHIDNISSKTWHEFIIPSPSLPGCVSTNSVPTAVFYLTEKSCISRHCWKAKNPHGSNPSRLHARRSTKLQNLAVENDCK